jgi:hypothetical protein
MNDEATTTLTRAVSESTYTRALLSPYASLASTKQARPWQMPSNSDLTESALMESPWSHCLIYVDLQKLKIIL